MAVLIDPPAWPAHGTVFSHLVSDSSLSELHAFAQAAGIPARAFDHDHYDVPERRYADLVDRGAQAVSTTVLMRRLLASGLRMRTPQRTPKRHQVLPGLTDAWARLLPQAPQLGAELLERWQEPHRHYHDVRHLAQVLGALDELGRRAELADEVRLAAWFHDAVYACSPGTDEEASAELAAASLSVAGLPPARVDEVVRLVLLTVAHAPPPRDVPGAQLADADLSILGQPQGRYDLYVRDVRLENQHLSDADFATGRLAVLDRLQALDPLYRTQPGSRLWADAAAANLSRERARWSADPAGVPRHGEPR